jgi:hypothetical protein
MALRAPVDNQERLIDPLLLLGLHDRLRCSHERRGIVRLLAGKLFRPAYGVHYFGVLGEVGQGELPEHGPLAILGGRHG